LDQSPEKGDRTTDHHTELLVKLMHIGVSSPLTRSAAGSARAAFPSLLSTIRALRLPALNAGPLMSFTFPVLTDLPLVRSGAAEIFAPAWPRSSPVPLAIVGWSNAAPPRFLGNPSHIFAPLSDPGRFIAPHLVGYDDAAPTFRTVKTPAQWKCRDSITRLRCPLPTLQVVRCRTRMQGSLPVGG
jgi:hypothetical protein